MPRVTAVVDGHVHIHACYDIDELFDHAWRNLSQAVPPTAGTSLEFYLLMTESAGDHYFQALCSAASSIPTNGKPPLQRWAVSKTTEDISVVVSEGGRHINVVGGRQVACKEGLEVLFLGTTGQFTDRRPIREVLDEGAKLGVARVIPWGAGNWFFGRARLLSELLRGERDPLFFLGDEGGRPGFWPYPRHFREAAALGVRDLPGTDPLPFPHDIDKVGKVGFTIGIDYDAAAPAGSLLSALRVKTAPLERFARLESPVRFVRNQVAMQLRKRQSA